MLEDDTIGPVASNGKQNGSAFFTPAKTGRPHVPVFKTPMTFSPRIVGEQAKPSPSRFEMWKEELGFDDASTHSLSDSDQSMEEDNGNPQSNGICPAIELQALQRAIDERDKQRDELLFRLKTLTYKNKLYKEKLEKEENNKRQMIKILKKTHETHLQEKENLVKVLENVVDENENKIYQLEAELRGEAVSDQQNGCESSKMLIIQISSLQKEKADLSSQLLTAQHVLEVQNEEVESTKCINAKLDQEKSILEEEVILLKNSKGSSGHAPEDREKILKQEAEIENLKKQFQLVNSQLLTSNGKDDGHAEVLKILNKENENLKLQIKEMETNLSRRKHNAEKMEVKLKEEIRMLTSDHQANSREVRNLSAKLTALQARSPEIVTKIHHVEVENTGIQEELVRSKEKLEAAVTEKAASCKELSVLKIKCDDLTSQLHLAERKIHSFQDVSAKNESLGKQVEEYSNDIRKSRQAHDLKLQENKNEINKLLQQVGEKEKRLVTADTEKQELEKTLKYNIAQFSAKKEQMIKDIAELQQIKDDEIKALTVENEKKMADLENCVSVTKKALSVTYPQLQSLAKEYIQLKKKCEEMPLLIKSVAEQTTKQLCKALDDMSHYNQELVRKYRKEMQLRKKYHNELVELKGNIRVFCRLRPKIKEDGTGANAKLVVECDADDDSLVNVMYKTRPQVFDMDCVFSAESTQAEVFSEVQALATSCVDGYNVCIFAYGQTGSGKTHTMEGAQDNPGINQRALKELFRETAERSQEWKYIISVSFVEIYNETIRDLLGSDPTNKLDVKLNPNGGVHVPGLSQYEVASVEDVNRVFSIGKENRATAATNMNEHSSRSHALLSVEVKGTNSTTGARTMGKLNLVDLAGSERVSKSGADGARLKEAQNINKSLSCIGDVIHALRSKQAHIPYRNSKLTYLLQDSLGGDSKTLMIVQVSPVEKNVGESMASLNFAQRVRSVELGQATKKVENAEITELRGKLAQYEEASPGTTNKAKYPRRK